MMDRMMQRSTVPIPTLYSSHNHIKTAMNSVVGVLSEKECPLKKNEEGFVSIDELTAYVKKAEPDLSYINRNHIVELFFKERNRKLMINSYDWIKYKEVRYVQPPAVLYFGTLAYLSVKMKQYGIRSDSKGYLKLYSNPEEALELALKFKQRDTDTLVVLKIDAASAFSDGMKFSTFKDGEFIVVRLDRKYILGEFDINSYVPEPELKKVISEIS